MSSVNYKYKPDKHQFRVHIKTIDELHKEHVDKFKKNRDSLPSKRKRLSKLKKKLNKLMGSNNDTPINMDIEKLQKKKKLKKEIMSLEDEINKSENYAHEMDYYSKR